MLSKVGPFGSSSTSSDLAGYGRTLAYVWLGSELFNETLVARGFARVTTYPPNVKYVDRFIAA